MNALEIAGTNCLCVWAVVFAIGVYLFVSSCIERRREAKRRGQYWKQNSTWTWKE